MWQVKDCHNLPADRNGVQDVDNPVLILGSMLAVDTSRTGQWPNVKSRFS